MCRGVLVDASACLVRALDGGGLVRVSAVCSLCHLNKIGKDAKKNFLAEHGVPRARAGGSRITHATPPAAAAGKDAAF